MKNAIHNMACRRKNKVTIKIMAEENKSTVAPPVAAPAKPAPVPQQVDFSKALDVIEADAMKQVGSPNFNPYVWIKKNVTPIRAAIKAKEGGIAVRVAALKVPVVKK